MLKFLVVAVLALLVTPASAQFSGPGVAITIAEANEARLGRDVTVVGKIVGSLGDGYYTLRDDTGEIRVEIDRSVWRRRQVDGNTVVQLTGEMERDVRGRYLDVETLVILN